MRSLACWLRTALIGCLLVSIASAQRTPYTDLSRKLDSAKTPEQAQKMVEGAAKNLAKDTELPDITSGRSLEEIRNIVRVRSLAEGPQDQPAAPKKTSQERAASLKKSPVYEDKGTQRDSSWLSRAGDQISNLFRNRRNPSIRPPNVNVSSTVLNAIVWGVLLIAVGVFIWIIATQFSWTFKWKKKAKASGGIMEDDEPDRTGDEWLSEAQRLKAEGKFREAIRCLYLAMLVRLDDANVARLVRTETNWEHYRRIQASPNRPASLDFREPTARFDWIWYGMRVRNPEDVDYFEAFYRHLVDSLKGKTAA